MGSRKKWIRAGFLAWTLAMLYLGAHRLPAQEIDGLAAVAAIEETLVQAIERAQSSVVSIARIRRPAFAQLNQRKLNPLFGFPQAGPFDDPKKDPQDPQFVPTDFGSGVIIGSEPARDGNPARAYVLTNYHVVQGGMIYERADEPDRAWLFVRLSNSGSQGYYATIYAADPRCDLAVLIMEAEGVRPIRMGDANSLKKGQLVISLGNPYAIARDGSCSASWGMISNLRRRHDTALLQVTDPPAPRAPEPPPLGWLIQVDTRLDLGTSGGALINLKGELIGLTTSLAALDGYEKSAGYAVAMDSSVIRIVETLQKGLEVEYGFLGVQFEDPRGQRAESVFIKSTLRDGPADLAGIQDNDAILAVNGHRIVNYSDLNREIGYLEPGSQAQLSIGRLGLAQPLSIDVRLGKWPVVDEENLIATQTRYQPWRGLMIDYSTARHKHVSLGEFQPKGVYPKGVLVLDIRPQSPAARSSLTVGRRILRVNQTEVNSPSQFYSLVATLKGPVTLYLDNNEKIVLPE